MSYEIWPFRGGSGSLVGAVSPEPKPPASRGFDLMSRFAFFMQVPTVDAVYDRNGEADASKAKDQTQKIKMTGQSANDSDLDND
jgi:hypothetical protein